MRVPRRLPAAIPFRHVLAFQLEREWQTDLPSLCQVPLPFYSASEAMRARATEIIALTNATTGSWAEKTACRQTEGQKTSEFRSLRMFQDTVSNNGPGDIHITKRTRNRVLTSWNRKTRTCAEMKAVEKVGRTNVTKQREERFIALVNTNLQRKDRSG